jgi:HAD superfamily hydrolase (TIGR01493 family)
LIRGIVFDLFDTLVDQNHARLPFVEHEGRRIGPTTTSLHRHLVGTVGLSLSLGEFADLQQQVDRALFRETLKVGIELPTLRRFEVLAVQLGVDSETALARELTAIHMGMLRDAVSVPEHHEAILASLAVDHRLGLCSNFSHGETARAILDAAGLTEHFQALVISEDLGIRKPRPEIFESVARALDLAPDEILHVGDNLQADVGGAAACGMRTVWLTRQIEDPDALLARYAGPPPDFALEDLTDLPVLVARLSV